MYSSLSYFDPCYEVGEAYNYLIFPISHIANLCSSLFAACELIVTGKPHGSFVNISSFLPALLDAFENHTPYVRKVVNALPFCFTDFFSIDVVFNKALFFGHMFLLYFISSNLPVAKGPRNNLGVNYLGHKGA